MTSGQVKDEIARIERLLPWLEGCAPSIAEYRRRYLVRLEREYKEALVRESQSNPPGVEYEE